MTKRTLFQAIAGLFCVRKAVAAPKVTTPDQARAVWRKMALLDGYPPCDELNEWNKPIAILIGTGEPPEVDPRIYRITKGAATEKEAICHLIGWKGDITVHLFGEWETIIRKGVFLTAWRHSLCRNEPSPKLFINGLPAFVYLFETNAYYPKFDHPLWRKPSPGPFYVLTDKKLLGFLGEPY